VAVLDNLGAGGQVGRVPAGAREPVVAGQQVVDLAGHADPGGDEHDQVVADAFQVGDQVRGQDHAGAVFGDIRHQALQELPPGEGVEAGDRFVEDEQVGSFRNGQGQRELRALSAGELPGLLGRVEAELGDPVVGKLLIPTGVGVGAETQVIGEDTVPGAWVLSNQTITPTGQVFTGPANPQYCGPDAGPQVCLDWIDTLGLRQDIPYQPANHFWPLQWTEAGICLAVSVLLVGFCFWWTRRRLT